MIRKRDNKKQLLIDAAKHILLTQDLESLTLDSVAKEAGMSKGGLLYHFPTKEALLSGVAASILISMEEVFQQYAAEDPIEKGRWTRAFIRANQEDLSQNGELNAAILAHSALSADMRQTLSTQYQEILRYLERDELSTEKTLLIRLALDGLYYSQLFQIAPIDEKRQQQVFSYLQSFVLEDTE